MPCAGRCATTQAHGGRAYLAHPYWVVERGYHLPSPWYDRVLEEGILDGIELLGDVKHENNARSLARYLDFRASGGDIPIVGNSDTHRAEHTYGTYWTLVYAARADPGQRAGGDRRWLVSGLHDGGEEWAEPGRAHVGARRVRAGGLCAIFWSSSFSPSTTGSVQEEAALASRALARGNAARGGTGGSQGRAGRPHSSLLADPGGLSGTRHRPVAVLQLPFRTLD